MAKFRRRMNRRGSYRGFHKRARHSGGGLSVTNVLLAGAAYRLARPYISAYIPSMNIVSGVTSTNLVLGGLGVYGAKKGKGFMKALGVMAAGYEAGDVGAKLLGGALGVTTNSTSQSYAFE